MLFEKAECLASTIKVAVWGINYQKGQCIYKEFISYLNQLFHILTKKIIIIIYIIIYIIGIILIMFR